MQIPIESLERYAFADLAAGKDAASTRTRRHARQCIVVGARDWLNRWFWLHIWAGRLTASDFRDRILSVQEDYEPRRFGLEANGMQVLFGSLVRDEARERLGENYARIVMVPIYQPSNVEKTYRIRTGMEPVLLQGRFFLQPNEIEARSEIQGFPTSMTKDIVDAMETLMNRVAPKRLVKEAKDREEEDYAVYLRASGMPAHRIEQELQQFHVQRATDTQPTSTMH